MNKFNFPLNILFKITTFSNDFVITDVNGDSVSYVRQKILKLLDEVQVYKDESRSDLLFTIKANKWIDFNATYVFTNAVGLDIGRIVRKGLYSLWKAHYEIYNKNQQQDLLVREENPWVKVIDSIIGEIPLIGILAGYLFHPSYIVLRNNGNSVVRITKEPSFFGRKFRIDKLEELNQDEEERIVLGLMMMILLERQRG